MRANVLTGSAKKSVMLLGWCCSIFRALAVIPSKQKMGNKKVEGKGGWIREKEEKDRRKEKQQRESGMNKKEGRERQKEGKAAKGKWVKD